MVFSNRETVSIHLGQAGCQLANSTWELYCYEHGIKNDGSLEDFKIGDDDNCFHTFFCESQTGKFVPRAILVDTEPTVSCGGNFNYNVEKGMVTGIQKFWIKF
jgi:tubulin alpha